MTSYRFLRRTTTRDSIDLDGQPRTFTLAQLCDFIVKHPSLHSANIVSCSSYVQRTAIFVPHRFLIFQLRRARRKDVWLRLDRRTSEEAGTTGLILGLGVTEANDLVGVFPLTRENNDELNNLLGEDRCNTGRIIQRRAKLRERTRF